MKSRVVKMRWFPHEIKHIDFHKILPSDVKIKHIDFHKILPSDVK